MTPWWSWGPRPARVDAEAQRLIADLERRWGPLAAPPEAVATVPPVDARVVAGLRDDLGAERVRDDPDARLRHAIGQSYPELRDARRGVVAPVPLAVVTATTADVVSAALRSAAKRGLALLPFGGGTSVTGGVSGPRDPYVVLSLRDLRAAPRVDRTALVAHVPAGMNGVELDAALAAQGVWLGHYPQSFERSTVGGWVATRSVGQLSTGVGAIADLLVGLRAVAPTGDVVLPAQPAASEGPELRELLLGSEGRFAIITEAALRVRPAPEARRADARLLPSFAEGIETIRALLQSGVTPTLIRLSDEVESVLLGVSGGALLLTAVEGAADDASHTASAIAARLGGATPLGTAAALRWYETRFDAPHLRDALIERDVLADSLETAALWSDVQPLYAAVRRALAQTLDAQRRALVLCHVSHAYATGASLYFTFVAPGGGDAEDRWRAAKRAALDAIVANGGVVSHHHGIGRDHRAWLADRYGGVAERVVDAVAGAFDPAHVLAANRAGRARTD